MALGLDRYAKLEDLGLTLICADGRDHADGKHRELSPQDCDTRELSSGAVALSCPACHMDLAIFGPMSDRTETNLAALHDRRLHEAEIAADAARQAKQTLETLEHHAKRLDATDYEDGEDYEYLEEWVLFLRRYEGSEVYDYIDALYDAIGASESVGEHVTAAILTRRILTYLKLSIELPWWKDMLAQNAPQAELDYAKLPFLP